MNTVDRLARWRGTAANAGLGLVFAVVLAKEDLDIAATHGHWLFDCVVGLVVCTAALLRDRDRVLAAVVGLVVSGVAEVVAGLWDLRGQPGIAATLALLVLVGSAVRVLPVWPTVAIAVGGAVVAAGAMSRHPDVAGALGLGWGTALGIGLWLRFLDARRQTVIETVRRDERLGLARELHDSAAHHVTGIVIQAQAARIAARRHAETLDDALAGIESVGTDALTSMRQVIGLLRDADDAGGLTVEPEDLTDLVERFAGRGPAGTAGRGTGGPNGPNGSAGRFTGRTSSPNGSAGSGPAVQLRLPDGPVDPDWPPEVATTIYRVVSEALTNITRHAPRARSVIVTVAHDRRAITVEITDDAPQAGSARFPHTSGYGLIGMRERVEALGGTLSACPGPVAGWSVLATLPAPGTP